jgi:hypothetical protein
MSEFVVEVNEGVIEATRQGSAWWQLYRERFVASGTLREVKAAFVVGGVVHLGPYKRDVADFMAEHMVQAGGVPASAVKVKRASR